MQMRESDHCAARTKTVGGHSEVKLPMIDPAGEFRARRLSVAMSGKTHANPFWHALSEQQH